MTRARFAPWLVFACMGALVGCNSTEGGPAGNTELNVVIPSGSDQSGPGAPSSFDIQVVEYTITCDDGIDYDPTTNPDIDNGPTLDNDVSISGVLEVLDTASAGVNTQDFGPDLGEVYVWQGFMDLPPTAGCSVQLRARDGDGEVICSSTEAFDISADTTTKVNVLMICGISYQAPVGMLDLDGDFSFNVANYCPDLFVLNCIDSELDVRNIPGVGDVLATACQVRFRDADSQCGDSCDPQTCTPDAQGLTCTPGPDPLEPTTTVTCASTLGACAISCNGATPAASCTFSGDTLGTIGDPPPGPLAPGDGGFFVTCATVDDDGDPSTPNVPVTPGDTITCTAVTTDGDVDCDKTKTVDLTIAGLSPCQNFTAGGGTCDDGNSCTDDICVNATCDGTVANCCTNPNSPAGQACTIGGFGGTCDGNGLCVSTDCNAQPDPAAFCEGQNPNPTCNTTACEANGSCSVTPANEGGACSSGTGSDAGVCTSGTCSSLDECLVDGECPDPGVECQVALCDTTGAPYVCGSQDAADGTACTLPGGGAGACAAGICEPPPTLAPGSGTTSWNAQPRVSQAGTCTYDSVNTVCTGCQDQTPVLLQPGGGQCAQFGTQVFGGCEVPGGVLNAQLAIDATVAIAVSSDGAGNVDTDVSIVASNPALSTAAGLVTVDAASIFTSATSANPAQLQNDLNPAFAGQVLGAFTGGGNILTLDSNAATGIGIELPVVTTAVTPISDPVLFDYDNFSLTLTIVASGTPLLVDDAGCDFNFPGSPVSIPQNP